VPKYIIKYVNIYDQRKLHFGLRLRHVHAVWKRGIKPARDDGASEVRMASIEPFVKDVYDFGNTIRNSKGDPEIFAAGHD